ncbi:MAG: hypothetical protein ABW110_12325 [Steroidobacteraceae bacterium]
MHNEGALAVEMKEQQLVLYKPRIIRRSKDGSVTEISAAPDVNTAAEESPEADSENENQPADTESVSTREPETTQQTDLFDTADEEDKPKRKVKRRTAVARPEPIVLEAAPPAQPDPETLEERFRRLVIRLGTDRAKAAVIAVEKRSVR